MEKIEIILKSEEVPGNNIRQTLEYPIGYINQVEDVLIAYLKLNDCSINENSKIKGIETKLILNQKVQ